MTEEVRSIIKKGDPIRLRLLLDKGLEDERLRQIFRCNYRLFVEEAFHYGVLTAAMQLLSFGPAYQYVSIPIIAFDPKRVLDERRSNNFIDKTWHVIFATKAMTPHSMGDNVDLLTHVVRGYRRNQTTYGPILLLLKEYFPSVSGKFKNIWKEGELTEGQLQKIEKTKNISELVDAVRILWPIAVEKPRAESLASILYNIRLL